MTSKQTNAHSELPSKFWSNVQPSQSGCWLWTASKKHHGYGQFYVGGQHHLTHRLSYERFKGEIPEGMYVCHSCDNPACVNPRHLFLGTPADNMADMKEKGRQMKGEAHCRAKLTEQDVREIRKAPGSQRTTARAFGVSQATVCHIKRGITWAHLS